MLHSATLPTFSHGSHRAEVNQTATCWDVSKICKRTSNILEIRELKLLTLEQLFNSTKLRQTVGDKSRFLQIAVKF